MWYHSKAYIRHKEGENIMTDIPPFSSATTESQQNKFQDTSKTKIDVGPIEINVNVR